jgi:hypothetical protein
MFAIRNIKRVTLLIATIGAVAINVVSRLWRYPSANAFLIIVVSIPFVFFFIPAALAKRRFAHLLVAGFLIAAIFLGVVTYYGHGQEGPEIPTMYFVIPLFQSLLALLASVIAMIDYFIIKRHDKQIAR